jgi:hypothetical protein
VAKFGPRLLEKANTTITNDFKTQFDILKKDGKIPEKLQEPLANLIKLTSRPETPTIIVVSIFGMFTSALNNPNFDPDLALPAINDFSEMLKNNPKPTLDDIKPVVNKNSQFWDTLKTKALQKAIVPQSLTSEPTSGTK